MAKEHLHSKLDVPEGQVVQVTLEGVSANVMLLDDKGYDAYQKGESYDYFGGHYEKSPVVLRPPKPGPWHLVVDLGGTPGEVRAAVLVRPK